MIGDIIKRKRKELGLTYAQAASSIGIHPVTFSRIESSKMPNVKARTLFRICAFLKINIEDIYQEAMKEYMCPTCNALKHKNDIYCSKCGTKLI